MNTNIHAVFEKEDRKIFPISGALTSYKKKLEGYNK